jgi:hypothetical protein
LNSIVPEIVEEYPVEFPEHSDDSPRISDSLHAICHEHRYKIASFDPFPHAKTLNASRGILHLMGIVISRPNYSKHHAWMVLSENNLSDAIEMTFGLSFEGLRGILAKMPTIMFSKVAYERLAGLLVDHRAMKVMAHTDAVTSDLIDRLHHLPEELRLASVIKQIIHPNESRIIELASCPDDGLAGSRSRSRLSARLSDCRSRKAFWTIIQEELLSRLVDLPEAPEIDHPFVRPLSNFADLTQTASRFSNCLRMCVDESVRGEIAFYVYENETGQQAVISVKPLIGPNGLEAVIDDIKGPKNADVPAAVEKEIEAIFAKAGILRPKFDHDNKLNAMSRYIRDLKSMDHPADIQRAAAKLEDTIYAAT